MTLSETLVPLGRVLVELVLVLILVLNSVLLETRHYVQINPRYLLAQMIKLLEPELIQSNH